MDNPWCVEADVWRADVAAQPPMIIDVTSVDYEYVEEFALNDIGLALRQAT
jgi:hypothetical protein